MTITSKPKIQSKTLWSLAGTAAAFFLPAVSGVMGVDPTSPIIGTIHGVGVPLGLVLAAASRITSKHTLR